MAIRRTKSTHYYEMHRPIMIRICKDGTFSYGPREKPAFNGRALPVFSVDTEDQAKTIRSLFCRLQYGKHPQLAGPWYKWTDFSGNVDDLDKVSQMIYTFFHKHLAKKDDSDGFYTSLKTRG